MPSLMNNADSTLRSVCASMEMEGFHVSKQTQEDCRAVLRGEKTADEIAESVVYSRK